MGGVCVGQDNVVHGLCHTSDFMGPRRTCGRRDWKDLGSWYNYGCVVVDWFFSCVLRLWRGSHASREFLVSRFHLSYIASCWTCYVVGIVQKLELIHDCTFLFAVKTIEQTEVMAEFVGNCIG